MKTSDLIERAGVSRRALRLYEDKGLVRPDRRMGNGYRDYDRATVERIHAIRLLQSLGFTLNQIGDILTGRPMDWATTLELQEDILLTQQRTLSQALKKLRRTLVRLKAGAVEPDRVLLELIGTVEPDKDMKTMQDTVGKYYSDKARQKLANHPATPQETEVAQNEWPQLYAKADALAKADADPAGPEAQAIVIRADALIAAFTLNDPDITAGLTAMWRDREHWSSEMKERITASKQAEAFLDRARKARTR